MARLTSHRGGAKPGVPRPRVGRLRLIIAGDTKVHEWYDERALRSRLSADTYARQLSAISERLELTPEQIVALARGDPDRLRARLTQCAAAMKRKDLLDSYISKWFESLKSYLRFRRVQADVFPRLSATKGESLSKERVPTPEEMGRILERLTLRGRVIALLMAHPGLRPGVIGSYGGENGLRLQDLPDLSLGSNPNFEVTPFVVRVPAALSKTRVAYTTFGTAQLATTLLAYLGQRQQDGEKLAPTSPVVVSASSRGIARRSKEAAEFCKGFLTTKAVVQEIRQALSAALPEGVTWRPYVLRAYCSTRLMLAEGSGKISRDLREAILGHDGGVAARYNVGKRWGEELLAEARREFGNASEFLETNAQSKTNVAAEFRRTLLGVAGLSDSDAAQHMEDSNEELLAILRTKLLGRDAKWEQPTNGNGRGAQKPVSFAEAEQLLPEGWTFVANFGPDRVLLQPPS